jgi:hypothetical protein
MKELSKEKKENMDKIIWVVYRESDSHNYAAFYSYAKANEYLNKLIEAYPDEAKDYYIDEICLFEQLPEIIKKEK